MSQSYERYGQRFPWLGTLGYHLCRPFMRSYAKWHGFYDDRHPFAQERSMSFRKKLERGETIYLVGLGVGGHNSGTALAQVSQADGVRIVANNEEERFTQVKHCTELPRHSIQVLKKQLAERGIGPEDVHAYVSSWNYPEYTSLAFGELMSEMPGSWVSLRPAASPTMNGAHFFQGMKSPPWVSEQLGLPKRKPILGLRHHDNHAYFPYAVSPFAGDGEPVMVGVIDGSGDDGSITFYRGKQSRLEVLFNNRSMFDSLALVYGHLSSALGGWSFISSEGRYMGASAWGNQNRLTNPFYLQLRQLVYFAPNGRLHINRNWANWQQAGVIKPYSEKLANVIGPPVPLHEMWNPDAILNVENIQHSPITQDRVDKAAALQMLYEDMLCHVVGHWIRSTGSSRLVLSGGAALNCVANMRLLESFDEAYYERYLGQKNVRLQLWIPPIPGDAGCPIGAAFQFALRNGAPLGPPLEHAFYCGEAPTTDEIRAALQRDPEIGFLALGNVSHPERQHLLADLLAFIVSQNGIMGLFQGAAETGPRALGHRSILANPANPQTRENLNQCVKFRELVRPLAPMATYEAAHRWFELSPGAAADHYNAYNYMVLTAHARPGAYAVIPAVIHADGTCRVQIVRPETDPFSHAFLKAMGRRIGAEVSVNTSLNVGSPIVQTPAQALDCLKRSKGMMGLFMLGSDGEVFVVWHNVDKPPKDYGRQLLDLIHNWEIERQVAIPGLSSRTQDSFQAAQSLRD
jgi:carbamoyltransferase